MSRRLVLRTPGGALAARVPLRALVVGALLLLIALAVAVVNLCTGDFPVPVRDVFASLVGQADPGTHFIVVTLRLPRVLLALLVGAALGTGGAIFQSLSRNPLGSPDFVGLTVGASTGALVVLLALHGAGAAVTVGALLGCLATFAVIWLLAYQHGSQAFRLVLMGIGVSALLASVNSFLIVRARLDEALAAQRWLVGSLHEASSGQVWLLAGTLAAALPILVHYGRQLDLLALGEAVAITQGVPVERSRAVLALVSVVLTAVATAVAGPVAFVALAAPQVARRLTGASGAGLIPAAVTGAALLAGSDFLAQRALPGRDLPVGVVTAALGGAYLTWLLAARSRRGRAFG